MSFHLLVLCNTFLSGVVDEIKNLTASVIDICHLTRREVLSRFLSSSCFFFFFFFCMQSVRWNSAENNLCKTHMK